MTSKEKQKFRSRSPWKHFRIKILYERNYTCEICGITKKKGLQVHHLDEENYTDLNPTKFRVLCSLCHKEVERLLKRKELDINTFTNNMKEIFLLSKGKDDTTRI